MGIVLVVSNQKAGILKVIQSDISRFSWRWSLEPVSTSLKLASIFSIFACIFLPTFKSSFKLLDGETGV